MKPTTHYLISTACTKYSLFICLYSSLTPTVSIFYITRGIALSEWHLSACLQWTSWTPKSPQPLEFKCCQSSKFKMLGWTSPAELLWALLTLKKTCLAIRKTVLPEVMLKGNLKSSVLWTVSKHGANFIDCTHCNCVKGQQLDLQIYITHTHKTDKAIKCLVTPHALS